MVRFVYAVFIVTIHVEFEDWHATNYGIFLRLRTVFGAFCLQILGKEVHGAEAIKVLRHLLTALKLLLASLPDDLDAKVITVAEPSIIRAEKQGLVQVIDKNTQTQFCKLQLG